MREPVTWDRGGDPVGIAEVVHPGWVQRALTAEDWRGFPGNEPGGGENVSKVERIAQQIFDKLAELHITYVYEPAESVPGAQRVRAVDEVLSLGQATCLDMCAAFCSAALDAGIYPLVLTVRQEERRRHALVLVPVDRRWSFGVPALLGEGFSRSPLVLDGDDVRDLVANVPDDVTGAWLAIDVEQATYSADRGAGDWACAIASGASYVKEWDWDVCVDVGGIRAQQDNSSELPTLARTEKVLAPGYLPLPDDSTPLQMIQTRYGVVPFCSRPEYRELKEWAVGTAKSPGRKPDVSVAVLTGAGGTGKTRMAAQLCHDLEVLGWYTGFAPAKSTMENDELTYLAELTTELLVVVDYAEESRQEQLAALLRALRGRRSPTRIVLTARGIDSWWEDFREELESDGTQLGQALVKELEPRPDPVLLYRQAVRGFSKVINGVNPPEVEIPEHTGDTALDIVLRAWLAVVDDGGMQDPQSERSVERGARSARAANLNARDSLYDRVLRLEFNRWRTFPELQDISLIHLRRIVATLSLLVPDAGQVDDVLSRLPEWRDEDLRRSRLAELLSTTLLRSAGDGTVSLRPDPVAEHLNLSVFGDDPDQVDAVLPGDPLDVPGISEPDASEATVTRAVMLGQQAQNLSQVITRAASQDQESATALAQRVLKACPHLWSSALEVALAQGGPFAHALERLIESGAELPCAEIQSAIPLGHSTLRGVALAAMQRMEAPSERNPVKRAIYLHNLAIRLSGVGRSVEALEAAQEAVGLFRELVENSPEDHAPGLAGSLNNLANILSGLGRSGEALEVSQEAAGLYRELAQASPAAYTPDLALSLNNLASKLSAVGQYQEALEVAQETVRLRRALVEVWPETYTPGLAITLGNLAMFLSAVGQNREALVAAQEAVHLRRALVEAWPEVYTSDLAVSLDSLAKILSRLGRRNEGLVVAREAVRLFRKLVEVSPAAYTPDLALSLSNLSNFLPEVGLLPDALVVAREAVGLYRDLAEASPAVHMPNLAMSLNYLGRILMEVGLVPEALVVAREAVGLYRDLAEASPAVHMPNLAMSLRYLGNILAEAGYWDDAVGVVRESVGLYRDLAETSPAVHTPDLAMSLNNLAGALTEEGQVREALGVVRESVGLYRDLAETSPAAHTADLAMSLGNLASILSGLGRSAEALEAAQEAAGLYRELVEASPAAYTADLARSLGNLASILSGLGRSAEA
uniref:tetratricopeptide repeat protein n=1 Tax=Actinomyces oris TaxID=544580 RepID=UPI0026ED7943